MEVDSWQISLYNRIDEAINECALADWSAQTL